MTEKQDTVKVKAFLSCSLDIECPACHESIDLFGEIDDECCYSKPIFQNSWEDLNGEEVCCSLCGYEFEIEKVEY